MTNRKIFCAGLFAATLSICAAATPETFAVGSKHGKNPIYPSYEGRIMAGYQGWFRAPGDGSGRGWVHWGAGNFDDKNCTVEAMPEMSEYEKGYPTGFKSKDGKSVEVFSSYDYQTVDTHFKWMKEYGIDGAMVQRFFVTTDPRRRDDGIRVLQHAKKASAEHGRALVVMYDLSGAQADHDASKRLIADWKYLVDELKITGGDGTNYMFHNGKPLVSIWGIGFVDRPYTIENIGIEKFIDFLRTDKEYGGCAIMLGLPPSFRTLNGDAQPDKKLHELIAKCDVVSPWNVGRFAMDGTPEVRSKLEKLLRARVSQDIKFCKDLGADYAPVIYPGFSWYNLMSMRKQEAHFNAIPRLKGKFYWTLAKAALDGGAKMIYIAMFDEVDEGTAIFKISDKIPASKSTKWLTNEGMGSDYYLFLSGEIAKALRGEIKMGLRPPANPKNQKN